MMTLRILPGIALPILALVTFGGLPQSAGAGALRIFEASAGSGQIRTLAGPVTNLTIDVDYAPVSAEGGRLFGLSEIEIETTGDLRLTPSGFLCQASPCLYSPNPITTSRKIRVTAGNDLAGETAAAANLFRIGLTGSTGYVVVSRGEYLDGTGPGGSVGAVRTPDVTPLVRVPEPGVMTGLLSGGSMLGSLACARARRLRRARASARSEPGPASPAPRAP